VALRVIIRGLPRHKKEDVTDRNDTSIPSIIQMASYLRGRKEGVRLEKFSLDVCHYYHVASCEPPGDYSRAPEHENPEDPETLFVFTWDEDGELRWEAFEYRRQVWKKTPLAQWLRGRNFPSKPSSKSVFRSERKIPALETQQKQ